MEMHIQLLSTRRFRHTLIISVLMSALIVAVAASLGRAMINLNAAMTGNSDLAVFLLLQDNDKEVTQAILLRERKIEPDVTEHDYLVYTAEDGTELVTVRKQEGEGHEWHITRDDPLHE